MKSAATGEVDGDRPVCGEQPHFDKVEVNLCKVRRPMKLTDDDHYMPVFSGRPHFLKKKIFFQKID